MDRFQRNDDFLTIQAGGAEARRAARRRRLLATLRDAASLVSIGGFISVFTLYADMFASRDVEFRLVASLVAGN